MRSYQAAPNWKWLRGFSERSRGKMNAEKSVEAKKGNYLIGCCVKPSWLSGVGCP